MPRLSVEALVERLRALARERFPTVETTAFLKGHPLEPVSLDRYVFWTPGKYARNLIHKEEAFEVLALCWDAGQGAPVHGHEGEKCWTRVERGRLRFANYREIPPRPPGGGRANLAPVGAPVDAEAGFVDGPADIHAVVNLPEFGGRAVSLHLYTYPYEECEVFDLATGAVSRMFLRCDSKFGKRC